MQRRTLQPLLKWAGGKEKELGYIIPNIPNRFNHYYEPFVGGGSVFTTIPARHHYINDLSSELITLYTYIHEQNSGFFKYVKEMDLSWKKAESFLKDNLCLLDIYITYRPALQTKDWLKEKLITFCKQKKDEMLVILNHQFFSWDTDFFCTEIYKNLYRKMGRMKILEAEKGLLSPKDLHGNLETAIKSALYMYFRHLYNNHALREKNKELSCALFFFIRNYSYSGMFRYNDKGEFNVPYGGMAYNTKFMAKKLEYYRSAALQALFSQTTIYNMDFEKFLCQTSPKEDDFVFLDPPYDSEFNTYAQNEFTHDDHKRLANYMLKKCKAKWMLVIKNTDFIYNLYQHKGINIRLFDKEYLVSFMNRNNKKATHLLITNY